MLVERTGQGTRITAAAPEALRAGARPGQSLADARAACPGLRVLQAAPEADRALLEHLARRAQRHAPIVAMDGPDGLLLDTTGCAHLFGGEAALLADCLDGLARAGLTVRAGLAPTPALARALSGFGAGREIVLPAEMAERIDRLPVEALRLAPERVVLLRRLGLTTVGRLRALPRVALERRFRSREAALSVRLRLDQITGAVDEPLAPLSPPPLYRVQQVLPEPVIDVSAASMVLDHLLLRLAGLLERDGRGARLLTLSAFRADGGMSEVRVRLARPARDAARIGRLFAGRLEEIDSGFGIDAFVLSASGVEALDARQDSFVAPPPARGRPDALPGMDGRTGVSGGANPGRHAGTGPGPAVRVAPAPGTGSDPMRRQGMPSGAGSSPVMGISDSPRIVSGPGRGSGLARGASSGPGVGPAGGAGGPGSGAGGAGSGPGMGLVTGTGAGPGPEAPPGTAVEAGPGADRVSAPERCRGMPASSAGGPVMGRADSPCTVSDPGRGSGLARGAGPGPGVGMTGGAGAAAGPGRGAGGAGSGPGIGKRDGAGLEPGLPGAMFTLVDTLANRLGGRRVYQLAPVASHLPERAMRRVAVGASGGGGAAVRSADPGPWPEAAPLRPLRLLPRPEPVEVTAALPDGPPLQFVWRRVRRVVLRAAGPERIAPEWWHPDARGTAVRDYYHVEDREGCQYWLCRALAPGGPAAGRGEWYLHGLFA
ncbi:Y-family DNA polymerase [Paroceanicella profunda]|uniref:Y-family DNA polymerase n=1 Tax=Paroceanicella profunda TaxID=2579971 RepID=UPI0024111079|nr:DNA polymerase Y family protein [Paroceanicella profunda]